MNALKQKQKVEPTPGQVYEIENTGERMQIAYADDEIVLAKTEEKGRRGNNGHRIERRVAWGKNVEAGHFEYKPDSNIDLLDEQEQDWSDVDYIGEKTSENLHDEGFETNLDIQQADEAQLLMVDGLGAKGLENLQRFVQ